MRLLTALIPDPMGFVDDDVIPDESISEEVVIARHHFIRREDDVELSEDCILIGDSPPLRQRTVVAHHAQTGAPAPELVQPRADDGQRNDDQMRTVDAALVLEIRQEGDDLNSERNAKRKCEDEGRIDAFSACRRLFGL